MAMVLGCEPSTLTGIQSHSEISHCIYKVKPLIVLATVSQSLLTDIGYYVRPRDGSHFVRLFADAQFYSRGSLPATLRCPEVFG
jgi:hypothetical protein